MTRLFCGFFPAEIIDACLKDSYCAAFEGSLLYRRVDSRWKQMVSSIILILAVLGGTLRAMNFTRHETHETSKF